MLDEITLLDFGWFSTLSMTSFAIRSNRFIVSRNLYETVNNQSAAGFKDSTFKIPFNFHWIYFVYTFVKTQRSLFFSQV